MRLKLIACKVLFREISLLASQCGNFVDITWMRQGYHRTPDLLRSTVQEQLTGLMPGTTTAPAIMKLETSMPFCWDMDFAATGLWVCIPSAIR
jgi:hypothetical protein